MSNRTQTEPSADQAKRKRPLRRLMTVLIVLVVIVAGLALAAPMIASSGFGTDKITGAVNRRIAGTIEIGSAGFGWFRGQSLNDVKLLDPQGNQIITFEKLNISATLWSIVTGSRDFGRIELTGLRGDIAADESGSNNLLDAIAMADAAEKEDEDVSDKDEPGKPFRLPGLFELVVGDAQVRVTQPGNEPVELTDLELNVAAVEVGRPITSRLTGKTRQGALSGNIDWSASLGGFNERGELGKPIVQSTSKITGLPIAGIDGMIGKQGTLIAVLGPKLDLNITSSTEGGEAVTTRIVARSSNLDTDLTIDVNNVMALAAKPLTLQELLAGLNLSGQVKLSAVPAGQLDQLLSMQGKLAEAVGDRLDFTLTPRTDPQRGQVLAITMTSRNHNSQLTVSVNEGLINIVGQIRQLASPALVSKWTAATDENGRTKSAAFALVQPVPIDITLQRLSMPLGGFDPAKLAARSTVSIGDGAVRGDETIGTIGWSGVSANITTDNLAEAVAVTLNGATRHADQQGQVAVNANLNNLFSAAGEPQFDKLTADGNIKLTGLPTPPIDQIAGLDGMLVDALGQRITLAADVVSNGPNDITANITAESATLNAQLALHADAKQVTLKKNTEGTVRLLPAELCKRLSRDLDLAIGTGPHNLPMQAELKLSELVIPRPAAGEDFDLNGVRAKVRVGLQNVAVSGIEAAGPLHMHGATLSFEGKPNDLQWALTASIIPQADSIAAAVPLGEIKGDGQFTLDPDQGMALPRWAIVLAGPRDGSDRQARLVGSLDTGMNLKLTEQSRITATLTPQQLTKLGMTGEGQPQLTAPVKVTLTLDSLNAALKEFSLAKLRTAGSLIVDRIALAQPDQAGRITLSGLNGIFNVQGPTNRLVFKADGKTTIQQEKSVNGTISADVDLSGWLAAGRPDFTTAKGKAKFGVTGLPVALVETFTGMAGKLQPIVGPTLAAAIDADLAGQKNRLGSAAMAVKSRNINGTLNLALADTVQLTRASTLTVALNDTSLQALRALGGADAGRAAPVQLLEPTTLTLQLEKLIVPMPTASPAPAATALVSADALAAAAATGKSSFDMSKVALRASLSSPGMKLRLTEQKLNTELRHLKAGIATDNPLAGMTLDLNAQLTGDRVAAGSSNAISAKLDLADLTEPDTGKINYQSMTARGHATVENLPTALLDAFNTGDVPLSGVFGPTVTMQLKPQVVNGAGPVTLVLRSSNAVADAPLRLNKGLLTLDSNVTAKMIVTEELTRHFIDHPLLKQTVRSLEPIQVTIYNRAVPVNDPGHTRPIAFAVPLDNPGKTNVRIPKITIEPGKLVVRKAGLIKQLLELPETVGKLARLELGEAARGLRDDELLAWFTPVDFALVDGVARYTRMDMLLGDNYQVATWGTLNFSDRPIRVGKHRIAPGAGRMILGISERALRRVYGIAAFEDQPDYADQFVMQGPVNNLSPNVNEMTARLAALTATGIAGQFGGGDAGIKILQQIGKARDILDTATGKGDEVQKRQFDPPPPARKPFPWPEEVKPEKPREQEQRQPAEKPAEKKEKKEKPEEKIIKDVLKDIFNR